MLYTYMLTHDKNYTYFRWGLRSFTFIANGSSSHFGNQVAKTLVSCMMPCSIYRAYCTANP